MSDLEWSPQQDAALADIQSWLREPGTLDNQVYRLFGLAGTGKSTLAKEVNAMVGGAALSCAYTGKAASVMARKGLPGATTIHRLIYTPSGDGKEHVRQLEAELALLEKVADKSMGLAKRMSAVRRSLDEARRNAGPQFVLKGESEVSGAPLLICDEVSMVSDRIAEDLLSFGVKILVMGDPAQLPPVRGTGYFMQGTPETMLTEIHRQALDNPILRIAHKVRNGDLPRYGRVGDTRVVERVTAEEAVDHDQILCGTNNFRRTLNTRHRQLKGYGGVFPQEGERLIALKNDHKIGLLNGTIWNATEDTPEPDTDDEQVFLRIAPEEGGVGMGVPAERSFFEDEANANADWRSRGQHFTYGYAMTTHKSQGSSWPSALVFGNDWQNRDSYKQWLYTACTRPSERLTLVL